MLQHDGALMNGNCCSHRTCRLTKAAGSMIPGAVALLLPKCPLCIVAWVAAGTGVAVPTVLAGSVRPLLAVVCALSVFLFVRRLRVI